MKVSKIITVIDRLWYWVLLAFVFLCPLLMFRGPGHEFIKEVDPNLTGAVNYVPILTNLLFKEIFAQCLIFVLLGLTLIRKLLTGRVTIKHSPLDMPIIAFVVIAAASFFYTRTMPLTVESWGLLASFVLLYYLVLDYPWDEKKLRGLFWAIITAGVITALIATLQHLQIYLGGLLTRADDRNRMSAHIGHNNGVAAYMMLSSFILLSLQEQWRKKKQWFRLWVSGGILTWFAFVILATLSRGVWMGTAAGLIILAVYYIKPVGFKSFIQSNLKTVITMGLVGIVFIGILSFKNPLNPLGVSVLQRFKDTALRKATFVQDDRIRMWNGSFEMIKEHPLTGVGIGGFKYWIPIYQGKFFARHPETILEPTYKLTNHSHNEYIETWAEMGVVGFLVMGWLLVSVLVAFYQRLTANDEKDVFRHYRWFMFCGMTGILVQSLVDFPLHVVPLSLLFVIYGGLSFWRPGTEVPDKTRLKQMERSLNGKDIGYIFAMLVMVMVLVIPFIQKLQADWYKNRMDYFLQSAEDLGNAGLPQLRMKSLSLALEYGKKCIDLDPRNGRAHYEMALGYVKQGDVPEAITHFELSLRDMQYADLHFNMADAYEWMRRSDHDNGEEAKAVVAMGKALEHYQMAAFIYPPRRKLAEEAIQNHWFYMPSEALHRQGVLLMQQGREKEAMQAWKQAAQNDPSYLKRKFLDIALDYKAKQQYATSADILEKTYQLDSTNITVLDRLAVVYYMWGKYDRALDIMKQQYTAHPQDPVVLYGLAVLYEKTGDRQKALDFALRTKAINPRHPELDKLLARLGH